MLRAFARRRELRIGWVALLAAIAVAVGAVPVAGAARPEPAFFGANIQSMLTYSYVPAQRWGSFIAKMAHDGLRTARMDAVWWWAEPAAPTAAGHAYVWSDSNSPRDSMDHLVGMLASHGVRLEAVLDQPPPWAQGPGTQLAPAAYGDFAAFAGAVAARYGAHGSFWREHPKLPYLPVEQFEVWDEANSSRFWSGTPDVASYAAVLAQSASAIHADDPSAQVLASIGWEGFEQYVSALYATGVGSQINGIAFHPYAPDAPGILELNEQLRATLTKAGAGQTPIFDTEVGQPAVTSGPGAPYAYDGEVTDVARAATESLAAAALARSDCGVRDYLVFGLTGSGTSLEPNDEGFMGILKNANGAPDATGAALAAVARSWDAHPSGGLMLCGSGTTPRRDLLALGVRMTRPGPTCVGARVTYRGDPLEGALLVLRTRYGPITPAATNAFGQARLCLANGPAIKQFTASAEIVNVATSPTYDCPASGASCVREGRRAR